MEKRAYAIDLLRGLAIIGMVLSAQILWHAELPSWLFHAQIPPPDFKFDPTVAGITWVDLVFPFFLFSMGAAFPLAMRRRIANGESVFKIMSNTATRFLLLALFAIALGNFRSGALGDMPVMMKSAIQIVVWGLFCCMFLRLSNKQANRRMHILGIAGIVALMLFCKFIYNINISLYNSDIIILVLSSMVLFGTILWWVTRDNTKLRLGVIALVVAMKIAMTVEGSWNAAVWEYSPAPWLFKFEFLKYLCIVLPGSIAGDLIYKWLNSKDNDMMPTHKRSTYWAMGLLLLLFVVNMWGLFVRQLPITVISSLIIGIAALQLLRRGKNDTDRMHYNVFAWGLFWLVLGLVFEAYEGGIKKDYATLSYFFITSGLASAVVVATSIAMNYLNMKISPLVKCGQNPMVAYTVSGFLIMPVITLLQLAPALLTFSQLDPWMGVVRGVIITSIMVCITNIFTNKRLFWRT